MTGVRYRHDTGFEGRCDGCCESWPMTLEFWNPQRGFRFCRACLREQARLRLAKMREDPAVRARHNVTNRRYYAANKGWIKPKAKLRLMERRLLEEGYIEQKRAYHREWMRRARKAS